MISKWEMLMEKEQISEILADMLMAYTSPGLGRAAVKKAAAKIATTEISDSAEIKGENAFEAVRDAFSQCGTVLGTSGDKMLCGVILSGAAAMNPCYFIITAEGNRAEIRAYAKEGLIKQHTAEKAVKALKEAIDNIGTRIVE